jgi:predicted TIM-barrel fold metal-dependent hydrolase
MVNELIIDNITHITPDGHWFHTNIDASEKRLLMEMDENNVSRAIIVALADYISNDFVFTVCENRKERFIPCASFNPVAYSTEKEAVRELRNQLYESPMKMIKLHPRLNGYDPLAPRCLAILGEMSSWSKKVPIYMDSLFYRHGIIARKPVVDTIHELVNCFSSLDFVFLHAGGAWVMQLAEAIRDCPNVYLDISFIINRYAASSISMDLKYLISIFDQRMIFGSDFPEIGIGEALETFRCLCEGINYDKVSRVMGGNLFNLLGKWGS